MAELRGLPQHIQTFDGTYTDRAKRGSSQKSTNAWGIGFDIELASGTRDRVNPSSLRSSRSTASTAT